MQAPSPIATDQEILMLSSDKFRWKTTGNIDAVADLFDDELVFVHLDGHISSKREWIDELRAKRFVYHTITFREASAKVYGSTAVLVGKATFNVTMNGRRGTYNLVYTEVYTRKNDQWKLVNLHTCSAGY
ncbi:nuclear transport factor 2 family protein [Hymenobacter negativus]|uniref:Nuclear transport factor 2 family protein n=1 Tax=Hymenobacter negativus TaxID=2795026 RepID=A0ABS3Q9S9_9BACT|nr:nuclear transport factor 2 family protein [Hymenobacter negativus]MBO2007896.1 nuclear transport factor 2 family protein [Hymenobacter negativus]